jgi:hypothetical protein
MGVNKEGGGGREEINPIQLESTHTHCLHTEHSPGEKGEKNSK